MTKYVALKSFRGQEGPIRRGQDMPDDMTADRIKTLERNRLIGPRKTGEAPAPRNQALPGPKEPPGMDSPNAGGLVHLGWDPNASPPGDGTRQARPDQVDGEGEDDQGNGEGAAETIAPIGSSTSPDDGSSSSQAAPPPAPLTSPARSPALPKKPRGNRKS